MEQVSKKPHKFSKTTLIYLVCALVSIISIIAIIIIVLSKPKIDDSYFVSDDTKTVVSLSPNDQTTGSGSHINTFVVYTYDGDNVVGLKTYFEYTDVDSASAALESYKSKPEFSNVEQNDKYIIVSSDTEQFKGLTADDVRQQAEAIQKMQAQKSQSSESQPEAQPEEQTEDQP